MGLNMKFVRHKHVILLLLITLSARVFGSVNSGICHFYSSDQLSSNHITSICQDKLGFIWVSTEYGLNRLLCR